jgi:hypothetical protein
MRQIAPTATWAAETGLRRTQQLLRSAQTPQISVSKKYSPKPLIIWC